MSNSCTQFALVTVIQLLMEAEVVLSNDDSAIALGKLLSVAPDAEHLDLVNVPVTFD